MLEVQSCWSESILWVQNFLYIYSGLGTWKSLIHSWSFFSSQNSLFLALRPENAIFFTASTVDFPTLEDQTWWSEPLLWVRNLLYQCSGLGTWKSLFHSWSFFSSQNSLFLALRPENPTCFNSSTVDFPVLETQTCWSEPILWVRDILYHYSGLGSWKRFFCLWLFFNSQKFHFF